MIWSPIPIGVGAVLVMLGFWAVRRGWRFDPSHGRNRCRRCWYEIGPHVGLQGKCPECGLAWSRLDQLIQVRRSWLLILGGWAGVIFGGVLAVSPTISSRGVWAFFPTSMLIDYGATIRGGPVDRSMSGVLTKRYRRGWPRQDAVRYARRELHDIPLEIVTRSAWPEAAEVRVSPLNGAMLASAYGETRRLRLEFIDRPDLRGEWFILPGGVVIDTQIDVGHGMHLDSTRSLGSFDAGSYRLLAICILEQAWVDATDPPTDRSVEWLELVRRDIALSFEVVTAGVQVLEPFSDPELESQLEHFTRLYVSPKTPEWADGETIMWASLPYTSRLDGITLALRVEFRKRDEVVAVGKFWKSAVSSSVDRMGIYSEQLRRDEILIGNPHISGSLKQIFDDLPDLRDWRVRIVSDSHLALRDLLSVKYWNGEFDLPLSHLTVAGPENLAIPADPPREGSDLP